MRGQMDKSLILNNWDSESLKNQCPGVKRQASWKNEDGLTRQLNELAAKDRHQFDSWGEQGGRTIKLLEVVLWP